MFFLWFFGGLGVGGGVLGGVFFWGVLCLGWLVVGFGGVLLGVYDPPSPLFQF